MSKLPSSKTNPGNFFEDFAVGLVRFDNGAMLTLETSWLANMKEKERMAIQLYGTEGGFEENVAGARWVTKDGTATEDLDDVLKCADVPVERVTGPS